MRFIEYSRETGAVDEGTADTIPSQVLENALVLRINILFQIVSDVHRLSLPSSKCTFLRAVHLQHCVHLQQQEMQLAVEIVNRNGRLFLLSDKVDSRFSNPVSFLFQMPMKHPLLMRYLQPW